MRLQCVTASSLVLLASVIALSSCNRVKLPFLNQETEATEQVVKPDHFTGPAEGEGPRLGLETFRRNHRSSDRRVLTSRYRCGTRITALLNLLRLKRTDLLEKFFYLLSGAVRGRLPQRTLAGRRGECFR